MVEVAGSSISSAMFSETGGWNSGLGLTEKQIRINLGMKMNYLPFSTTEDRLSQVVDHVLEDQLRAIQISVHP